MTEAGAGGVGLNSSDNDKVSLRSCPEHRRQSLKMLIGLEGAHAFYVSIFGGVEHLRTFAPFRVVSFKEAVGACLALRHHANASRLWPTSCYSAVDGSMVARISVILSAGNPLISECRLMAASSVAR